MSDINYEVITISVDLNGLTNTSGTNSVVIQEQTITADVAIVGPPPSPSSLIPLIVGLG